METDVVVLTRVEFIGKSTDNRSLVGTFDKKDYSQQQPHFDSDGEVEYDGQHKGNQHHYKVGFGCLGKP